MPQNPNQPYSSPIQGYSWAGQPPSAANPFMVAGTSMIQDYAIMRQQQDIAQYQQIIQPPPMMPYFAERAVAYNPQYQFGVMSGQWENQVGMQNRAMTTAMSMGLTAGTIGATWPLMTASYGGGVGLARAFGATGPGALSMSGLARGAMGLGVSYLATLPFTEIANRAISRQQYISEIGGDIAAFEGRFTQGRGFGRADREGLAQGLMSDMRDQPAFFRPEDQMKIHKYGLATGMIKGKDVDQYKKSFNTLKDTMKEVVTLMNTTIEGGLSVMQDLQRSGFRTPEALKQQVMQAKSWGNLSGIGAQNMMAIGAAGAQAAYGTGWAPGAASNLYQAGATVLTGMAYNNPALANTIANVGGPAQAGGMIANSLMNVMRSGMGLQAMTYAMDPNTKQFNMDRLSRLATGQAGALEIVAGSNAYGASGPGGGAGNRVLAARDVLRNLNQSSPETQMLAMRGIYQGWSKQYSGLGIGKDALTYQFSQQFSSTPEQADLMQSMLMAPSLGFENMYGAKRVQDMSLRMSLVPPTYRTGIRNLQQLGRGVSQFFEGAGDFVATGAKKIFQDIGENFSSAIFATRRVNIDPNTMERMYGANQLTSNQLEIIARIGKRKGGLNVAAAASDALVTKMLGTDSMTFLLNHSLAKKGGESDASVLINKLASSSFLDRRVSNDLFASAMVSLNGHTKADQVALSARLSNDAGILNRVYEGGAQKLNEYRSRADSGDKTARNMVSESQAIYTRVNTDMANGMAFGDAVNKAFPIPVGQGISAKNAELRSMVIATAPVSVLPTPFVSPGGPIARKDYEASLTRLGRGEQGFFQNIFKRITPAGKNASGYQSYRLAPVSEYAPYARLLPSIKEGERAKVLAELGALDVNAATAKLGESYGIWGQEARFYTDNRNTKSLKTDVQNVNAFEEQQGIEAMAGRVSLLTARYGKVKGWDSTAVQNLLYNKKVDLPSVRKMFPDMDLKGLDFEQTRQAVAGMINTQTVEKSGPAAKMKEDIIKWSELQNLIDNKIPDSEKKWGNLKNVAGGAMTNSAEAEEVKDKIREDVNKMGSLGIVAAILGIQGPGGGGSSLAPQAAQPAISNYWNNRWFASGVA